jgi:hypothetical protein
MMSSHQLTAIFCEIDDFCKELDKNSSKQPLLARPSNGKRGPARGLSVSEIMTIQILFQMIGWRNFKVFYTGFLQKYWKEYFPKLPSYQRFIELMHFSIFPLTLFVQFKGGKKTGIYYIDGSCLPVCHMKRSKRNKVFNEISKFGKTSVGWFFGLKIHLVINNLGEIMAFKVTRGNVSDSSAAKPLLSDLQGLAFGDKGYIEKII